MTPTAPVRTATSLGVRRDPTRNNARAVSELCRRLEGIPLAIELAAAQAAVMSPAQMLANLSDRFAFLVSRKRDTVDRHRTLRGAVSLCGCGPDSWAADEVKPR